MIRVIERNCSKRFYNAFTILLQTVESNHYKTDVKLVTFIYLEANVGSFTDIIHNSLGMKPDSFGLENEKLLCAVFHYYK